MCMYVCKCVNVYMYVFYVCLCECVNVYVFLYVCVNV